MHFSQREIIDLLKAWVAISLAFGIILRSTEVGLVVTFIISAFTVGIGFLLHELAHKFVAQRYGHYAEFHSNDQWLLLAIGLSFLGFVFAAPGAVHVSGYVSKQQNGIISFAGPAMNIALALLFFGLLPILGVVSLYGFMINSWLALFNMIPFGNFDGVKILDWDKIVYGITVGVAALLVFFSSSLPQFMR